MEKDKKEITRIANPRKSSTYTSEYHTFRTLKKLEDATVYHTNILRLLSYSLMMLVACYLIAAFQQGFMCFQFGYCLVTNMTHSPYWENKPLNDETLERVNFALYWAMLMITFTCHLETWGTENWRNVLYTLFMLEICIVLRIFMEAAYSATILVTTALREDYDASILIVKNFLARNQVDPVLSDRFISYLQLCWYTDKAFYMTNRKCIFYDLPPHVYHDLVAKQRSKYILAIPFMKYLNNEDLKKISIAAKLFYTPPNEVILNTGDMSNEMYVIKEGICEIMSPDTKRTVGLLNPKCHFGVLVCLMRVPSLYTIRAVTNVHLFSISRKHLKNAIAVPQIRDALNYIKRQPEFSRLQIRRQPFISYKVPDPIPNLERFRLPRKHEQDTAFLYPFYRLGFLSILRYIFPRFTIRPDGRYIMRYEWFRASCALTSAMVFPGLTYFSLQWNWLNYLSKALDFSAYFDIVQRMLIGYYNSDGILVSHPASTAAHYLKGAFFVDLFGCLPMGTLEITQIEAGNRYCVSKVRQFLLLNRLIQLYRVPSAMNIFSTFNFRRDIITVFKAIPILIVLLNVMTCFMVLYSVSIYFYIHTNQWMIVPFADEGGSWIELFRNRFRFNITESPGNLHLATYFWVVYEITTTGYNILKPSNVQLIRIMFLGMLVGSMTLTYFSVRIISIRANVNKALAEFQEHMKDMVLYMRRENLNPKLQKEVLEYYEYNWDKMGGVDYRNMFKLCDLISLRTDAIMQIYGPTFAKCPILSQCDTSLLRIVGRAVHSAYFLRGMNIIEANDVTSDMFFVDYGGVDANEVIFELASITKLPRGSVFGNLEGLSTVRCPITFTATSRLHLLMIRSQTFHSIIRDFPSAFAIMKKYLPKYNNSYILGNVADAPQVALQRSSITEATTIVTKRQSLIKILYFNDKYVQLYLIVVSLLCVYLDVYNAGFQDNGMTLLIILYALDLCFSLKILMQFTLPLIVDSVNIRKILLPLRKKYFQGEFRYDLLSCIPIEILCLIDEKRLWFWLSTLRLNRMFRIVTVYNCINRHNERITINLVLSTTTAAFIWFTLFVHTTACMWYIIGRIEDKYEPKTSWIWKDNGTSWCDNEYICSLYFVLTTFTQNGVGDIMPKKKLEIAFVIILAILSTMIFMILVGEFSNIIQYRSFRSFSFYSNYLELQEFMKNNRVSKNLVTLVNKYSLHLWRETRGMQAPHLLLTAPTALRLQIMSAAYLHHLTRHHIFEDCEPAFLRQLVGCLELLTYNEDMYVVKSNEITDSMYLIHTGKVEEIADATYKVPRIYPAGSYFGVLQGMTHDFPYTHSYRTLIKSQVLTLRLDTWLHLLKHYPITKDAINHHMKYDDSNKDDGSDDTRKKPKPKPARNTRPTLVTDLVDKDSPKTPPQKRDGGIGEVEKPEKASKFVLPMGPQRSKEDIKPVTIQPGLWPTTSKHDSSDALQDITAEKQSDVSKVAQPSAATPFSENIDNIAKKMMSEGVPFIAGDESGEKEMDKARKKRKQISIKDVDDDISAKSDIEEEVEETEQLMVTVAGDDEKTVEETEQLMVSIADEDVKEDEETEQLMVAFDMTQSKTKQSDTQIKNDLIDRSDLNIAKAITDIEYSEEKSDTNLSPITASKTIIFKDTEDIDKSDTIIDLPLRDTNTLLPSTTDIDRSDTKLTRISTDITLRPKLLKDIDKLDTSMDQLLTDIEQSIKNVGQSDTSIILPLKDTNIPPYATEGIDQSLTNLARRATSTRILPRRFKDVDESDTSIVGPVTDTHIPPHSTKDIDQSDTSIVLPTRDTNIPSHSIHDIDQSDTTIYKSVTATRIISRDFNESDTLFRQAANPDILNRAISKLSQQSLKKTDQNIEPKTGPVKILKEGKVEKFDKRLEEIDDEFIVSTSKDVESIRRDDDLKNESTTTSKHRRLIRVRYEEDDKKKKQSKDADASDRQSDTSDEEEGDDDDILRVGSNTASMTSSTESFKRKKFKYDYSVVP